MTATAIANQSEYTSGKGPFGPDEPFLERFDLIAPAPAAGPGKAFFVRDRFPPVSIKNDHPSVIRFIEPDPANPASRLLFKTASRAASLLDHPNIVRTYETGDVDGLLYSLCEWPGQYETLSAVIARTGWLDIQRGRGQRILSQVLCALGYAHQQGILHLSLSSESVLLEPSGHVLVNGFGLAAGDAKGAVVDCLTRSLKPDFASPEQLSGDPVTTNSDLYSLGIVIYEVLTDRVPSIRPDGSRRWGAYPALPPNLLVPELPDAVSNTVLALLAEDPEDRFIPFDELQLLIASPEANSSGMESLKPVASKFSELAAPPARSCFSEPFFSEPLIIESSGPAYATTVEPPAQPAAAADGEIPQSLVGPFVEPADHLERSIEAPAEAMVESELAPQSAPESAPESEPLTLETVNESAKAGVISAETRSVFGQSQLDNGRALTSHSDDILGLGELVSDSVDNHGLSPHQPIAPAVKEPYEPPTIGDVRTSDRVLASEATKPTKPAVPVPEDFPARKIEPPNTARKPAPPVRRRIPTPQFSTVAGKSNFRRDVVLICLAACFFVVMLYLGFATAGLPKGEQAAGAAAPTPADTPAVSETPAAQVLTPQQANRAAGANQPNPASPSGASAALERKPSNPKATRHRHAWEPENQWYPHTWTSRSARSSHHRSWSDRPLYPYQGSPQSRW